MKVLVIASGSKGNSTLLSCGSTNILIDAGISYLALQKALAKQNLTPDELTAILITHTHRDHISGLASIVKKTNALVYLVEGMHQELQKIIPHERMRLMPESFSLNEFQVELFYTSHDVAISVGYIISEGDKSLVYVTDTGYINQKYLRRLIDKDIYIMESNHDEKMLMDGPYPYYLKQRVVSDEGHLSNYTASGYLKDLTGEHTKYIILAHLSEHNNTEDLALETLDNMLSAKQKEQTTIYIAKQYETTPMVEV